MPYETDTVDSMFNDTEGMINKGKEILQFLSKNFSSSNANTAPLNTTSDVQYCFSGQVTDLDYFSSANKMSFSTIDAIPDAQLKQAVCENFEQYSAQGLITIDNEKGIISITEKGKDYINDISFKQAANIEQSKAYKEALTAGLDADLTSGIELTGDSLSDFSCFNHTESLDLSQIAKCPNKKAVSQIMGNISEWKSQGVVTQGLGNSVKITNLGKQALTEVNKQLAGKALTTKSVAACSGGNPIVIAATAGINAAKQFIPASPSLSK